MVKLTAAPGKGTPPASLTRKTMVEVVACPPPAMPTALGEAEINWIEPAAGWTVTGGGTPPPPPPPHAGLVGPTQLEVDVVVSEQLASATAPANRRAATTVRLSLMTPLANKLDMVPRIPGVSVNLKQPLICGIWTAYYPLGARMID
jgi:hypothetical protein